MTRMIDPPEGWKYGFPKPLPVPPPATAKALRAWLLAQDYPSRLLDLAVNHSRYWDAP